MDTSLSCFSLISLSVSMRSSSRVSFSSSSWPSKDIARSRGKKSNLSWASWKTKHVWVVVPRKIYWYYVYFCYFSRFQPIFKNQQPGVFIHYNPGFCDDSLTKKKNYITKWSPGKTIPNVTNITDQLGDVHIQCAVIRFLEFIQIHEVVNVGPHIMVILDMIQHTLCWKVQSSDKKNKISEISE